MANTSWIKAYPEATTTHLPRSKSDHCPLKVQLQQPINTNNRPFRLEPMWCIHPFFSELIHHSFEPPNTLLKATDNLQRDALHWNKHSFGKIFHKLKRVLARLDGIQKANGYSSSPFLQNLEAQLLVEYNTYLNYKEEFWRTKSRINWLAQGDVNTKFFHASTLNRRRKNIINSLKDEEGNCIQEPLGIQTILTT